MASPPSKTAATAAAEAADENETIFQRAGHDSQQQQRCRQRLSSSRSRSASPNSRRLSAPHSTVGAEGIEDNDLSVLSSPRSSHSRSSADAGAIRPGGNASREIGRRGYSRHNVRLRLSSSSSQPTASDGGEKDESSSSASSKSSGARMTRPKRGVEIVGMELVSLHGGVGYDVEVTGLVVRWTRRPRAGQQREREKEKESGERREGGARAGEPLNSSASDDVGATITILSDDTDEPPVTIPMTCDGEYRLRRQGRYTSITSCGPLAVGRFSVPEKISKQRRRKLRSSAAKVHSSESSACGDSEETEAGSDDVDHGLPAAAPPGSAGASSENEKVVAVTGDSKAFVPPPEEKEEQRDGCSLGDSEKVGAQV